MSEIKEVNPNNPIVFQTATANTSKTNATGFNAKLLDFKTEEFTAFLKANHNITVNVSSSLKNTATLGVIFSKLSGTNNLVIADNILKQMLQDPNLMNEIISKMVAYFNLKNNVTNNPTTTANIALPMASGIVIMPDGTMGLWPFAFSNNQTSPNNQPHLPTKKPNKAYQKRVSDLANKRHKEIRNKRWQASLDEQSEDSETLNKQIADDLTKTKKD